MTSISFENNLIFFGFETKVELKKILKANPTKNIFMDLTCYDPAEFYSEFPQLKGAFSALFCDEEKKIEIHLRESNPTALQRFKDLGFTPYVTTIISTGFVFPRTIVQIINEAFYALEEKVAEKEDINRAMKFGVNYPKGPFEWCEDRELYVMTLLAELLIKTKDQRYAACKLIG